MQTYCRLRGIIELKQEIVLCKAYYSKSAAYCFGLHTEQRWSFYSPSYCFTHKSGVILAPHFIIPNSSMSFFLLPFPNSAGTLCFKEVFCSHIFRSLNQRCPGLFSTLICNETWIMSINEIRLLLRVDHQIISSACKRPRQLWMTFHW